LLRPITFAVDRVGVEPTCCHVLCAGIRLLCGSSIHFQNQTDKSFCRDATLDRCSPDWHSV